MLAFRCPITMLSGLTRHALVLKIDRSSLLRQLLREACEVRGIDISTI